MTVGVVEHLEVVEVSVRKVRTGLLLAEVMHSVFEAAARRAESERGSSSTARVTEPVEQRPPGIVAPATLAASAHQAPSPVRQGGRGTRETAYHTCRSTLRPKRSASGNLRAALRPIRGKLRLMNGDDDSDLVFAGSIPEMYDRYLVPLIFQTYASDLAACVESLGSGSLLEVAAGTGAVTREMAARLPGTVRITATDLNQPMLDYAAALGTTRPVAWQQADVMDLPFDDDSFDAAVCQFGVMFFPDRPRAFAEICRVLRPGGVFVFNVWDRLDENEFIQTVSDALGTVFPDDPPLFAARVAHGYYDAEIIQADLAAGGFVSRARFEALEARSRAETCHVPAIGFCQGTPLRNAIEARDPARLEEATSAAAAAIAQRFGPTDIDGKMRAYVITVNKP